MRSSLALALLGLAAGLCGGCRDKPGTATTASTSTITSTTASTTISDEDGRALVRNACLSCHQEDMLAQQRLTRARWSEVVNKMVGWGANLEPADAEPLAAWLAATYGPDAGPYTPKAIAASAAPQEIAALPDGPYAGGDAARGAPLYVDKCSGCHGADAKGHIGVILVDRPTIWRAVEFAEIIRKGRGKMTPIAMTDAEVADILTYLRLPKAP